MTVTFGEALQRLTNGRIQLRGTVSCTTVPLRGTQWRTSWIQTPTWRAHRSRSSQAKALGPPPGSLATRRSCSRQPSQHAATAPATSWAATLALAGSERGPAARLTGCTGWACRGHLLALEQTPHKCELRCKLP